MDIITEIYEAKQRVSEAELGLPFPEYPEVSLFGDSVIKKFGMTKSTRSLAVLYWRISREDIAFHERYAVLAKGGPIPPSEMERLEEEHRMLLYRHWYIGQGISLEFHAAYNRKPDEAFQVCRYGTAVVVPKTTLDAFVQPGLVAVILMPTEHVGSQSTVH